MAYPIKAIPTLYGEEASRFQKRGCNLNCVKACS